jgi:hypothetical protein
LFIRFVGLEIRGFWGGFWVKRSSVQGKSILIDRGSDGSPGFGKLVKQKRKARTGFNPKTQQKIKIRQISRCQGRKGRGSGGKEVA